MTKSCLHASMFSRTASSSPIRHLIPFLKHRMYLGHRRPVRHLALPLQAPAERGKRTRRRRRGQNGSGFESLKNATRDELQNPERNPRMGPSRSLWPSRLLFERYARHKIKCYYHMRCSKKHLEPSTMDQTKSHQIELNRRPNPSRFIESLLQRKRVAPSSHFNFQFVHFINIKELII